MKGISIWSKYLWYIKFKIFFWDILYNLSCLLKWFQLNTFPEIIWYFELNTESCTKRERGRNERQPSIGTESKILKIIYFHVLPKKCCQNFFWVDDQWLGKFLTIPYLICSWDMSFQSHEICHVIYIYIWTNWVKENFCSQKECSANTRT